jgi:hypothetical protein
MGHVVHHAVIVTIPEYVHKPDDPHEALMPDIDGFRAALPDLWQPLLVGPIPDVIGGYITYIFAPDGSKEGWPDSDRGDEYRQRFADLFRFRYEDGSTPFEVVEVGWDSKGRDVRDPREMPTNTEKG